MIKLIGIVATALFLAGGTFLVTTLVVMTGVCR